MHEMNLGGVDLNLLVSLQFLLEERSVTEAARRMPLSQPAMSHALARLRVLFDDPLLVRSSGGMVATPRAEALVEPLRRVLSEAGQLIRPPEFNPAALQGKLRLATTDYMTLVVLPQILGRLFDEAPALELDVEPWRRPGTWLALERGKVDFAIHAIDDAPAGFYRKKLFTDDFACVMRRGHPMAKKNLTLRRYVDLKHALITVTGSGKGHVNELLEKKGLTRDIVLRIPSFLAAPMIVAQSDLVLTLPRRLAMRFSQIAHLVVRDPPLKLGRMTFSLVWHERNRQDPAHQWVRTLFAEQIRHLDDA